MEDREAIALVKHQLQMLLSRLLKIIKSHKIGDL